jgi:hypothetical protein
VPISQAVTAFQDRTIAVIRIAAAAGTNERASTQRTKQHRRPDQTNFQAFRLYKSGRACSSLISSQMGTAHSPPLDERSMDRS